MALGAARVVLFIAVLIAYSVIVPVHAVIANPSGCTEKINPPKRLTCGDRVDLDDFTNVEPLVVRNLAVCRDLLWARHRTKVQSYLPTSFLYDTTNHTCWLYDTPQVRPNPDSETVLYDMGCFDCPKFCPQKVGMDLVGNGDFEASNELVGPWDADTEQRLISPGNYSMNAFSLYCGGPYPNCNGPSQDINVCEGTAYYFQFNYLYAVTKGTGCRSFNFFTNDGWRAKYEATPRNVWLREGHTIDPFPVSFDPVVGFFSQQNARRGDHFEIDNVRLVSLPETFPVAPGANSVIVNGGFEDGTIKPWTYRTDATFFNVSVVSPGIDSSRALRFYIRSKGSYSITLIQTIVTVPGIQYVVSLNMKYQSDKNRQYEGILRFGNGFPTDYKLFYKNAMLQAIFTAPTNSTDIRIYLPYSGKDPVLIDNIKVSQFAGIKYLLQKGI